MLDDSSGKLPEAVRLLDRLVVADPSRTAAGLDFAFVLCQGGHAEPVQKLLRTLQPCNPG